RSGVLQKPCQPALDAAPIRSPMQPEVIADRLGETGQQRPGDQIVVRIMPGSRAADLMRLRTIDSEMAGHALASPAQRGCKLLPVAEERRDGKSLDVEEGAVIVARAAFMPPLRARMQPVEIGAQ